MRSSVPPARRLALPVLVVLLVICALAPARVHVFGTLLKDIVSRALMPLTAPISSATRLFRQDTQLSKFTGSTEDMLSDQIRRRDSEIIRLDRENQQLRRTLAELQGLRGALGDDFVYRQARVLGGSPDPAADTVQIDLGARDGVRPGMAVVDARQLALVGRVIQAGPTTAAVRPLTSRNARIEVILTPPLIPEGGLGAERRRTVLLEFEPSDVFIGRDADARIPVGVGDYARLSDHGGVEAWPRIVQGMVIGLVREVKADPDQPLRQIIEVEPIRSLRRADAVYVVVPNDADDAGGSEERG